MFRLEIDDTVVVEQREFLEKAMSTNPKTEKELQKLIRQAILDARAKMVNAAGQAMQSDPRGARNSIRTSVYKKLLGANINIYDNKNKGAYVTAYEPPRTLRPGQRGGNRRERSKRTEALMSYGPYARGFILRWINEGTDRRAIQKLTEVKRPKGGSKFVWRSDPDKYGNRGRIEGTHWFKNAGNQALVDAANLLATLIDEELEKMIKNN